MRKINLIIVILLLNQCSMIEHQNIKVLKTVEYVDIPKFMGDWFVIANMPTFIEKNAINSIESYKLNKDGYIETTFSFREKTQLGKLKKYYFKGSIYNKETNAEWRMHFFGLFKMPFLIIDLDKQYQYTVIGYPNRKYLWIMSRNPEMDSILYNSIIDQLSKKGFDISKINKVTQIWD